MLRFTKDHEWLRLEGDVITFGITTHAQEMLGDIVFVELPEIGKEFGQGAVAAVVESVKAASEVYAPSGGTIIEVNQSIVENPKLINDDPMGNGWFAKIKVADIEQIEGLLDKDAYRSLLSQ